MPKFECRWTLPKGVEPRNSRKPREGLEIVEAGNPDEATRIIQEQVAKSLEVPGHSVFVSGHTRVR